MSDNPFTKILDEGNAAHNRFGMSLLEAAEQERRHSISEEMLRHQRVLDSITIQFGKRMNLA